MGETVHVATPHARIRLDRGNRAEGWGPRIGRHAERFLPRIAFGRPEPTRAPAMQAPRVAAVVETDCELRAREKAAFTLRLDPTRHARLKDACSATQRSAQQIVTQALDAFLAATGGPVLEPRAAGAMRTGGF